MSSEKSYFRLGLFVLLGLAIIIAGVVVLGAGAAFKKTVPFATVTTESVEGLSPGAPVKFRGVTIGKVADVEIGLSNVQNTDVSQRLAARNEILITMELDAARFLTSDIAVIRANFEKAADAGLRARITSSGIAGPPYVEFVFLDPASYPPPKVVYTPDVPYVPSAPGTLSKIAEDVGQIVASLRKAGIDKVVTDIDRLVVSVDTAVKDLRVPELRTQMSEVIASADTAVKELRTSELRKEMAEILANVNASTKRLDELLRHKDLEATLTELPKVTARLKIALDHVDALIQSPALAATLDNLSKVTGSANLATSELRRTLRLLNESLASQQETLAEVAANLRDISENANAFTSDVKQNPSRALFGQPPTSNYPGGSK